MIEISLIEMIEESEAQASAAPLGLEPDEVYRSRILAAIGDQTEALVARTATGANLDAIGLRFGIGRGGT